MPTGPSAASSGRLASISRLTIFPARARRASFRVNTRLLLLFILEAICIGVRKNKPLFPEKPPALNRLFTPPSPLNIAPCGGPAGENPSLHRHILDYSSLQADRSLATSTASSASGRFVLRCVKQDGLRGRGSHAAERVSRRRFVCSAWVDRGDCDSGRQGIVQQYAGGIRGVVVGDGECVAQHYAGEYRVWGGGVGEGQVG
jgi:hypothetical protein